MASESSYGELLRQFQDQAVVTIAAGTTCGCLGDERNLREFLVADEAAADWPISDAASGDVSEADGVPVDGPLAAVPGSDASVGDDVSAD